MSHPDPTSPILNWYAGRGWTPFAFQRETWKAYRAGESGLIHAATGTGKTYAAWMGPVAEWMAEHPEPAEWAAAAPVPLRVLWVTPLRALAADTEANLRAPLTDLGLPWTLERRTSDVPASVRNRQRGRLPTALVTTPESLSLFLTRPNAFDLFSHLRCVILDEWHELLGSKRGTQVELALARLRRWRPGLKTWALSATLGNLDVAESVLGGATPVRRVRGAVEKELRIDTLIPANMERFPWAGHIGLRMLDQVVEAIEEGETALVFTNTRAHTETWYQAILEARPEWAGIIALHHGSLDGDVRTWVEERLRLGKLRCVVCTSSLDLGVDFAPVDRVIQVGSPKGVARLLQRAGRSGHRPGVASRVTCVPTNAFELLEAAAARDAVEKTRLEARTPPEKPLDVLAQHVLTVAAGGGFRAEELYQEVRTAHAYRDLTPEEWQWVMDFAERGGRVLSAYPEYRRIVQEEGVYRVADATVARRHRLSVGTILSEAMIRVQYVNGPRVGLVEESYIARLQPGDRFILGGKPLEFVHVRDMTAWVRRASSSQGAIPSWTSGRQPLSPELAWAVRAKLDEARRGRYHGAEMEAVRPILELQGAWSRIPGEHELLIERMASREGSHLVFYPIDGRLVHEGMAALFAYRLSRMRAATFTFACNDYGFELLSRDAAPLDTALSAGLLSPEGLLDDILASLNTGEMARRHFRAVARVAGLVFQGFPGAGKTAKQMQSSSGLLYDVFRRYDPENLLLRQATREVLENQLERSRLSRTLERLSAGRVTVIDIQRPTPMAFPLMVDRLRDKLSTEKLADRVRRMTIKLEEAAEAAVS